jgi:AcrR family transcriptional regulator
MPVSRNYNSPLREEQMEQTRLKLLEALEEIYASDANTEITVAVVAARANISVRTAYRYFPTREAMIDAFNLWARSRLGYPEMPTAIETLPQMAAELLRSFATNERTIRATRHSQQVHEIRNRRKAAQVASVRAAVAKFAPKLDDLRTRQIGAVLHNAFGSEAWLSMLDHWGLSTPEAIEAVTWALDALIAKLETERARKGRK